MSSSSDRNYYHNQRLNTRAAPTRLPYNSSSSLQPAQLKAVHTNTSKPSRSLITVIPPPSLPSNPPALRSSAHCPGYGPPSAFSRGILIPLYPTLAAQLTAIAREYGLPSTGGMLVYMIDASPNVGELAKQMIGGPKISEAAWHILWSGIFEEEEAEEFERELQAREQIEDHHRYYPDEDQEENVEEAINSSVEDLTDSVIDFPIPPAHHRPSLSARGRKLEDDSPSTLPSSTSSTEDPSSNPNTDRRNPSAGNKTDDRFKLADRLLQHKRSQSSSVSPRVYRNRSNHNASVEMFTRPFTPLCHQIPSRSNRQAANPIRQRVHPAAMSDAGSNYSASSYRPPRRIGAGMIVGKIEFDIDCTRSTGRWYEQWLNPSRLAPSTTPDISRPLLLPNLITKRIQPSTSPNVPVHHQSQHMGDSTRSADLASSQSSYQTDNSHSFLAFDDPMPLSSVDLSRCSSLESPVDSHDRALEYVYRNSNKLTSDNYPLDSGRIFNRQSETKAERRQTSENQQSPSEVNVNRKPSSRRIVSDKHRQAISLIEAQAKHQALVDQIDAQLSSPIKLEPVTNHTFGINNLVSTLPGLSLQVTGRVEAGDSRYKRNEAGSTASSSCTSSPETDPANLTHSSTGSSSNSSVEVADNQGLLLPGLWSNKRSSSMAIEANLKELEQALVSLSPRALRHSPGSQQMMPTPRSVSSPQPQPQPQPNQQPPSSSSGLSSSTSPSGYPRKSGNRTQSISQSSKSINGEDQTRGGMSKFFDSLQESYHDMKARSSASTSPLPPSPLPPIEVPVGKLEGYGREDLRESSAPISPLPQNISITTTSTTTKISPPPQHSRHHSIKSSSLFFRKHGTSPNGPPPPLPTTTTTNTSSSTSPSSVLPPSPSLSSHSPSPTPSPISPLPPIPSSAHGNSNDSFVSKAAGLMSAKFRYHSHALTPKRKNTVDLNSSS
ncbi:hypothetical protein Pst134EB_002153 [Puccinia striiformis f. sp. tritici]|nr:hypothetical protein Pst134EB_002153 [Puccinia striiformis f. sp. tritici]